MVCAKRAVMLSETTAARAKGLADLPAVKSDSLLALIALVSVPVSLLRPLAPHFCGGEKQCRTTTMK